MCIRMANHMAKIISHEHIMINNSALQLFNVVCLQADGDSLIDLIFHPILRIFSAVQYPLPMAILRAKLESWDNMTPSYDF